MLISRLFFYDILQFHSISEKYRFYKYMYLLIQKVSNRKIKEIRLIYLFCISGNFFSKFLKPIQRAFCWNLSKVKVCDIGLIFTINFLTFSVTKLDCQKCQKHRCLFFVL